MTPFEQARSLPLKVKYDDYEWRVYIDADEMWAELTYDAALDCGHRITAYESDCVDNIADGMFQCWAEMMEIELRQEQS